MASKGKQDARAGAVPVPAGFPRQKMPLRVATSLEESARNAAALLTDPATAGLRVMQAAERGAGLDTILDVPALMEQLREEARAVSAGDMSRAEAMLLSQATALQSLFARLIERGMDCNSVPGFEVNLRFAMAAQRQSVRALEVLALYRQGPTVIARQANIATNQQINVGTPGDSRASGSAAQAANGLLEAADEQRLDGCATGTAGGTNRVLAPVGSIDGACDARGQGEGV